MVSDYLATSGIEKIGFIDLTIKTRGILVVLFSVLMREHETAVKPNLKTVVITIIICDTSTNLNLKPIHISTTQKEYKPLTSL